MKISEGHQFKFALFSNITLACFGLVSTVFINRFLGPVLKGHYTYYLNLISLCIAFLGLGIHHSYPYFKRNSEYEMKKKYANIYFFQFFLYISFSLLLSFFISDFNLKFVLFLIPIYTLAQQLSFILLIENPNLRNFTRLLSNLSYLFSLLIIFLFAERNNFYMGLILFLKDFFILIILITFFKIKPNPFNVDLKLLKKITKFGFIPMLYLVLTFLSYRIDIFVLDLFVNKSDLGIYSVGISLASLVWFIPDAFKEVLLSKTSRKDSISEIKLSIKFNFYISIVIFVLFIIFGEFIIIFLYGTEFRYAYLPAVILFIGNIPMVFYKIILALFVTQGKRKLLFLLISISVITNLIFLLILIPLYGIIGAAISNTISHLILGLLFLRYFIKFEDINLKDIFLIEKEDILRFLKEKF